MRIALEARDKYGFLTGEVEPPAVNDVKFRQWRKVNSTLISLILNSISRDIGRDFMFADDAKMLWNEFKEAFGACNGPKLYELMRNLYSINDSVARYHNKLKRIWYELSSLNASCYNNTPLDEGCNAEGNALQNMIASMVLVSMRPQLYLLFS
ncbi:hypothetical protein LIER_12592 [Lithospermum erythrorhizon]|uniref:Retrotransposon gag domain-containing protein n=1 Tax=Lithospermum erythrorhizon TaxID=34254 RepID=A0AAV3PUE0_LITER